MSFLLSDFLHPSGECVLLSKHHPWGSVHTCGVLPVQPPEAMGSLLSQPHQQTFSKSLESNEGCETTAIPAGVAAAPTAPAGGLFPLG